MPENLTSTKNVIDAADLQPHSPVISKSPAPVPDSIPSPSLATSKTRGKTKGNRTTLSREPSTSQKSVTFGSTTTNPPTSTRPPILRQLSASRIPKPPKAPPVQNLPQPPVDASIDDLGSFLLPSDSSPSSSILSFTSSLYPNFDDPFLHPLHSNRETRAEPYAAIRNLSHSPKPDSVAGPRSSPFLKPDRLSPPRNLKKASSHQSFSSKPESIRSGRSGYPPEEESDKRPRKQRSYHHPRARQTRPAHPPYSPKFASLVSHGDNSDSAYTNREATMASRKRLFSGTGMRRPTSPTDQRDPDLRSVLSLPLEHERAQGVFFPSSKPKSVTTSSLHESIRDEPPPPPASPEYVPQHILSPAEMLQVEASIEAGTDEYLRGRRSRVPSSSTTYSANYPSDMLKDFSFPGGFSPPLSLRTSVEQLSASTECGSGSQAPRRSSSTRSGDRSSLRLRTRPSTSQTHFTTPTSSVAGSLYLSPVLTETPHFSLPPPPRPRAQRALQVTYEAGQGLSACPYVPLSPPPIRRNTRSNPSLESAIMRRSIMRKPSFLEIEDDFEKESDRRLGDSFLDLNRESFDTLRSLEPDPQSFIS